ncbi:4024_t:CDS:2 [Ambispora gerdemannii]|uniref:4024_t:CDS:1 n=1 Tax=Ambispora gerdemannii TaxID=144530 RepID=A0A9N9G8V1_9GLOM|nr:4024_t:CDS:2 [Ambispora gerdemannii]
MTYFGKKPIINDDKENEIPIAGSGIGTRPRFNKCKIKPMVGFIRPGIATSGLCTIVTSGYVQ